MTKNIFVEEEGGQSGSRAAADLRETFAHAHSSAETAPSTAAQSHV